MKRKKERNCEDCIAYYNMVGSDENRCGLGFRVMEDAVGGDGTWSVDIHPFENECDVISLPGSIEEFVQIAASRGIEWDLDDVEEP